MLGKTLTCWHNEGMSSPTKQRTPEERKRLVAERAATRRRLHASRLAAKALATWLDPDTAYSEKTLTQSSERWLARLGEENVRRLAMRMRRMADWEMLRAEKMRDAGASPWTLLKYVGANQDMVIDGPACRDTIYADLMQYSNQRKQQKGREALIKVAIPLAVVATAATLVSAGVGYAASITAPALGADPVIAADLWSNWKDLCSPALNSAKSLATNFDVASGGFMFALGAFWMWAHDSRITEDLRAKAADKEVTTLEQAVGFAAKGHRIQAAIRAIPPSKRILLSHLSSTDLRAFLLSTDDERIHMLRENRPPLFAQFKSILADHPRNMKGILPAIRDIADVCLPKRWARAVGAKHPGEIGPEMMQGWRSSANFLSHDHDKPEVVDLPKASRARAERLSSSKSSPQQLLQATASRRRLGS